MASLSSKRVGTPTFSKGVSLAKKRRTSVKTDSCKVSLETVIGLTCHSSSSLSVHDTSIAYPAGCVAVLLDLRKRNRQFHVTNKKPISCLCFSPSGNHLATGECGHEPCVRVWELREMESTSVATLKGHVFGIQCVVFSSGQKYLVSIGYRHDRQIIVWNWKASTKLVQGKFGQAVHSVAFSHDHSSKLGNSYFVTAHQRRVQFWYYDSPSKDGTKKNTSSVLKARSAILGDLQDNDFVAVVCGCDDLSKNTYALTKSGRLCLFDHKRVLDKFTEIKASPACSMVLNNSYLFCGCADGIIRLFDPYSLDYIITLPRPHPLGVDISATVNINESQTLKHPDTVAMVIKHNKLSVVYNDHSLYVWDISNVQQVGKTHSFLFHNACIWDIVTYPKLEDSFHYLLPECSFITCSSDDTVRFWCLDPDSAQWNLTNPFSNELLRIIYNGSMDDNGFLKDLNSLPGDASAVADSTRGVRCIEVQPSGQHIAVGDREGNIKVYSLQFMDKIYDEVAHDSEILSVSYSKEIDGVQFLATGSRDRMIHIFKKESSTYEPIQSLLDHSAAVTAVKFVHSKDRVQLLSSGADKSIIFHSMEKDAELPFIRSNHIASKATIYDMAVDAQDKYVVTAGQDKYLRMYVVSSGKKQHVIKAPTSDEGSLVRVSLDPSGLYVATSSADKTVLLFDVYTGECVARLSGHSEVVTQVKFSQNCKYLYTVSGDSCIFVWRLSQDLTQTMHERLTEMGCPIPSPLTPSKPSPRQTYTCTDKAHPAEEVDATANQDQAAAGQHFRKGTDTDEEEPQAASFEFRLSTLPVWAQKVAMSRPSMAEQLERGSGHKKTPSDLAPPKKAEGKWAERVTGSEMKFALDVNTFNEPDQEMDDLTFEMSHAVGKEGESQDRGSPVIIDLTEDDSSEMSATDDSPSKISSEDSDVEVVYHTSSSDHLDVDPSIFSVTTPTKPDKGRLQTEDGESCGEEEMLTPDNSPPADLAFDEFFLKANYQSLGKLQGTTESPEITSCFKPPRLSISAKFLERTKMDHNKHAEVLDSASPRLADHDVLDSSSPCQMLDSGSPRLAKALDSGSSPRPADHDDNKSAEGAIKSPQEHNLPPTLAEPNVSPESPLNAAEEQEPEEDEDGSPIRSKRSSFELAVNETKKRLKDLGYIFSPSSTEKVEASQSEEKTNSISQTSSGRLKSIKLRSCKGSSQSHDDHVTTETDPGSGENLKIDEVEAEESVTVILEATGIMEDSRTTLASRASAIAENLDSNFRALTLLHEEALKEEDSSTVSIISRGISTHKNNVVNWTNKNRRLWREKVKSSSATSLVSSGNASQSGEESWSSGQVENLLDGTKGGAMEVSSSQGTGATLGPKEVEEARELAEKLMRVLSQQQSATGDSSGTT